MSDYRSSHKLDPSLEQASLTWLDGCLTGNQEVAGSTPA